MYLEFVYVHLISVNYSLFSSEKRENFLLVDTKRM